MVEQNFQSVLKMMHAYWLPCRVINSAYWDLADNVGWQFQSSSRRLVDQIMNDNPFVYMDLPPYLRIRASLAVWVGKFFRT